MLARDTRLVQKPMSPRIMRKLSLARVMTYASGPVNTTNYHLAHYDLQRRQYAPDSRRSWYALLVSVVALCVSIYLA